MKPKYRFFDNFRYAREGFWEVFKSETSFKIEVVIIAILSVTALFLPFPMWAKAVLIVGMFPVIIAELLNSAIERVVDMYTKEYHPLAKYAKDAGAGAVMFSIAFSAGIWIAVILYFCS